MLRACLRPEELKEALSGARYKVVLLSPPVYSADVRVVALLLPECAHDETVQSATQGASPGVLPVGHAEEEMVEDRLERRDIESAILRGRIDKKVTRDLRGGPATGLQAPRKMAAWSMSCVGLARLAALSSSPSMQ